MASFYLPMEPNKVVAFDMWKHYPDMLQAYLLKNDPAKFARSFIPYRRFIGVAYPLIVLGRII